MDKLIQFTPALLVVVIFIGLGIFAVKMGERERRRNQHHRFQEHHHHSSV